MFRSNESVYITLQSLFKENHDCSIRPRVGRSHDWQVASNCAFESLEGVLSG